MGLLRHRLDLDEPKPQLQRGLPSSELFRGTSLRGEHTRRREPEVCAPLVGPRGEAAGAVADVEVREEVAGVTRESRLGRVGIDRRALELERVAGELPMPLDDAFAERERVTVDRQSNAS